MSEIPKGIYEHYKGKRYEVIDIARHSETLEPMVIYKALYKGDFPEGSLWVRPLAMFKENVSVKGKSVPRFRKETLAQILIAFFILMPQAYARVDVSDVVAKMKKELNLTDEQVAAVKPIVKEGMEKYQAVLDREYSDAIPNKKMLKAMALKLRQEEDEQLSKILSEDQMKTLKQKRRMRESLNKDQIDFSEGLGSGSMSLGSAAVQF